MGHRIIDTQKMQLRGTYPGKIAGKVLTVLVYDDPELIEDDYFAPGVMKDIQKAWDKGDYFLVELRDGEDVLDSVGSMAGYGGPKKATRAAYNDYFKHR